jgi:hypothetical protein
MLLARPLKSDDCQNQTPRNPRAHRVPQRTTQPDQKRETEAIDAWKGILPSERCEKLYLNRPPT